MNNIPQHVDALFERDAALIREVGAALGLQIEAMAALIRETKARDGRVTIAGNRLSGAITAAAGLAYDVYLPPGQPGDLLLVVLPTEPPDDLIGVVAAARERGLTTVAMLTAMPTALAGSVDLCLIIPEADPHATQFAMVAVLRTVGQLSAEF